MSKIRIRVRSGFAVGDTSAAGFTPGPKGSISIKLKHGSTVKDLLKELPSLGPNDQWDDIMIHVFVNGMLRGHDHPLKNGDMVDLHIPVSGG